MSEREVFKYAITVPLATGRCETCGEELAYNLAAGICQHTRPGDCAEPWPTTDRTELP